MIGVLLHLATVLVLPFVLTGVIQRVKALWSGRKGPPILQSLYDVWRLLRKRPVYSRVATPLFRIAPWLFAASAVAAAAVSPLLGAPPPLSFHLDFVWLAYVGGLGRLAMVLAALDTGSAFEGMGAARAALFACVVEPVLVLVLGGLCYFADGYALADGLCARSSGGASLVLVAAAALALLIVLQVECARLPVDDPQTHLELTMVHEVMVLDHSGPDLAAIQYGSALKLAVCASWIATLLDPWAGRPTVAAGLANLLLSVLVAVVVATIESLTARLRLRVVPHYAAVALVLGVVALLATAWRGAPA